MANFARAPYNVGYCKVCGLPWPLPDLQKDGERDNLYVCPDCWDEDHPQKYPLKDVHDPIALRHPWIEPGPAANYLTDNDTTPPYPVRPTDSLSVSFSVFGVGTVAWPIESVSIVSDVIGGARTQVFFPVDYSYLQTGQTSSDYHEDLTIQSDVISGFISQSSLPPVEYHYLQTGQSESDYHEDLTIQSDVISGVLVAGEYNPIDYQNWPAESLSITSDVTGGSLSSA